AVGGVGAAEEDPVRGVAAGAAAVADEAGVDGAELAGGGVEHGRGPGAAAVGADRADPVVGAAGRVPAVHDDRAVGALYDPGLVDGVVGRHRDRCGLVPGASVVVAVDVGQAVHPGGGGGAQDRAPVRHLYHQPAVGELDAVPGAGTVQRPAVWV